MTANPGIAVTAFPAATAAAVEMLRAGGNALDAAIAAAWALAVCEPSGSGLGGKTVMLIRLATGNTVVVDGRSQAPAAVSKKRIGRAQQKNGWLSCSVPTTVAALDYAHRLYGSLPLGQILEPAIRLAEGGYPLTRLHCRQLKWCLAELQASPSANKLFLNNGSLFQPGDIFRQPVLARTLRRLAQAGPEDFYAGHLARTMVSDMAKHGALITLQDLAECARPVECEAVTAAYRGHQVLSVPPPGGGLQLLLALKVLERFSADELGRDKTPWYEAIAQVVHAVFRERDCWAVRPQDMTPSLARWMLSEERAAEVSQRLHEPQGKLIPELAEDEEEPGETTHLCAADQQGNVVALTQSIQSLFGAKVANEELGFLYNNCLCTCPRHKHPYQLASRCLPRSNLAPTIVLQNGQPWLALGAAGSRRILSALLQVISRVIDAHLPLAKAIKRPRVHVTLSGKAHLERTAATPELLARLGRRFGAVQVRAKHSYYMGAVQAIQVAPDGHWLGMADPRREGNAASIDTAAGTESNQ